MRLRETVGVSICLVYREALSPLDTLELDETPEGHARSSRGEAEDLRPLFAVERLERAPEPNNDGVRARVAVVLRRGPPLVDVDVGRARDEQLQLLLVELKRRCEPRRWVDRR